MTSFASPGPLTSLAGVDARVLADLPSDPVSLCRVASRLVIQPHDASVAGVPDTRLGEKQIRPASRIVAALLAEQDSPLAAGREPAARVVGTCRHFAVLSTALLRHRGIPARARCGFATYFQSGQGLDHWVTEFLEGGRWVRIDSEALPLAVLERPEDLRPGEFLTGGEAWAAHRAGEIDAAKFGVWGTENFGPGEIRGNAIRDLASLNKLETLPWDEWGRMDASYKGETGADYDELMDRIAAVDDPEALYDEVPELRVPESLIR
ncbi:MAG TPA: transglutaminase-like domain-containing protein [Actinoplanes sp.]